LQLTKPSVYSRIRPLRHRPMLWTVWGKSSILDTIDWPQTVKERSCQSFQTHFCFAWQHIRDEKIKKTDYDNKDALLWEDCTTSSSVIWNI